MGDTSEGSSVAASLCGVRIRVGGRGRSAITWSGRVWFRFRRGRRPTRAGPSPRDRLELRPNRREPLISKGSRRQSAWWAQRSCRCPVGREHLRELSPRRVSLHIHPALGVYDLGTHCPRPQHRHGIRHRSVALQAIHNDEYLRSDGPGCPTSRGLGRCHPPATA